MVNKRLRFFVLVIKLLSLLILPNISYGKLESKEACRGHFLHFTNHLLNWALYLKEFSAGESMESAILRLPPDKFTEFKDVLLLKRDILIAMRGYDDLHRFGKSEVIPDEIYQFIVKNFSISRRKKIDEALAYKFIVRLAGGSFLIKKKKRKVIEGFVDKLAKYDLSLWAPVKLFINNFSDTIALDNRLAAEVGRTILPILKKYYSFMDVETRINLFKNLLQEGKASMQTSSRISKDKIAARIFQNSGPLLIKMLQELQERVKGESPISPVLEELKDCRPMPFDKVKAAVKENLESLILKRRKRRHKIIEKPLGIASIGQVHFVDINGKKFVVKVQKAGVDSLFHREYKFMQEILNSDDSFDAGMKQWVDNIKEGIKEEIDFGFETRYLLKGEELYNDSLERISAVELPEFARKERGNPAKKIMFMSLASGDSAGKVMKEKNPESLTGLYKGIQRLYKKYLYVALSEKLEQNFYHGDLHRENIFYNQKDDSVSMIDFGNAGIITPFVRKSLFSLYQAIIVTSQDDTVKRDKAVLKVGSVVEDFIIKNLEEGGEKCDLTQKMILKSFFKISFDPETRILHKKKESKFLVKQRNEIAQKIEKLEGKAMTTALSSSEELELKKHKQNFDLINALLVNALNGPLNGLVKLLRSKKSVSIKLEGLFLELQRNGIAMSKEALFFNKSNKLLQGILSNVYSQLKSLGVKVKRVSGNKIFNQFLKENTKVVKDEDTNEANIKEAS